MLHHLTWKRSKKLRAGGREDHGDHKGIVKPSKFIFRAPRVLRGKFLGRHSHISHKGYLFVLTCQHKSEYDHSAAGLPPV